MKYRIVCVGKLKEEFYRKRLEELAKDISKTDSFEMIEVNDEKTAENLSPIEREKILRQEGERILRYLPSNQKELIVALCIEGKQYSTKEWAEKLHILLEQREYEQITYVIGGSLGLDDMVVNRADLKLSFSNMTFPHQLMRVVLAEQILVVRRYL